MVMEIQRIRIVYVFCSWCKKRSKFIKVKQQQRREMKKKLENIEVVVETTKPMTKPRKIDANNRKT